MVVGSPESYPRHLSPRKSDRDDVRARARHEQVETAPSQTQEDEEIEEGDGERVKVRYIGVLGGDPHEEGREWEGEEECKDDLSDLAAHSGVEIRGQEERGPTLTWSTGT